MSIKIVTFVKSQLIIPLLILSSWNNLPMKPLAAWICKSASACHPGGCQGRLLQTWWLRRPGRTAQRDNKNRFHTIPHHQPGGWRHGHDVISCWFVQCQSHAPISGHKGREVDEGGFLCWVSWLLSINDDDDDDDDDDDVMLMTMTMTMIM